MRALSPAPTCDFPKVKGLFLVFFVAIAGPFICWGQSSSVQAARTTATEGQSPTPAEPFTTPLLRYGALRVSGSKLVDKNGSQVQLKGICLYDTTSDGDLANPTSLAFLRDDWGIDILRAAMYTEWTGHFVGETAYPKLEAVVQAAIDSGLYVIIDWHINRDGDPAKYLAESKVFFERESAKFKNIPNVMYEICNEPNGRTITWEGSIKPYADQIIPIIRSNAPNSIILVGTPTWSQDVDIAADSPLPYPNLMYVLHFYAGSHFQELRDKGSAALSKGLPLFVSEFGTTRNTGSGGVFPSETITWMKFLNENKISFINWSLTARLESSAALKPGANPNGPWPPTALTESGLLVRSLIKGQSSGPIFGEDFESGNFRASNWQRDGAGIGRSNAFSGTSDATFDETASLTKTFDTSVYNEIKMSFSWRSEATKNVDKVDVEWFDGSKWRLLKSISTSVTWTNELIPLPKDAAGNKSFAFRFSAKTKTTGAKIHIDDVILYGTRSQL